MNEKLSAFVDNELTEFEERRLLSEMARDPSLRAAWERYHLIGVALRGEEGAGLSAAASSRIADSVRQETLPSVRRARFAVFGRAVGGLAIAASVATIAVISVQTNPVSTATPVLARGPAATAPVPVELSPLNAYLVEHNEYAPMAGVSSSLPYVRTVNDSNP